MLFGRYPDDHGLRIGRVGEARTSISDGSQVSLPPASPSNLTPTVNLILIRTTPTLSSMCGLGMSRVARDPRFDRLPCSRKPCPIIHSLRLEDETDDFDFEPCDRHPGTRLDQGTYADDCLVNRVTVNKCYVVATVSTLCVDTWLAPTSSLNFTPGFVFRLGLIV